MLLNTNHHENLSYQPVKPFKNFFGRHGMELIDTIRVDSHGGSLRGIVQRKGGPFTRHSRVDALLKQEANLGLHGPQAYDKFFANIQQRKAELTKLLSKLRSEGKKIVGFGAPAKATTLMFHFGIGPGILDYIVDDSPLKQGLYSPGHHIPVVSSSNLYDSSLRPDYVLILAWNFAEPIMKAHRVFLDNGGHFFVPPPAVGGF